MDIGVDQGVFHNDMIKTNDGKYIYKLNEDRYEINRFNRDFEQYKDRRRIEMRKRLDEKLAILNRQVEPLPIYNQSIGNIAIGAKDTLLSILDDLLLFNINFNTFTKDGRLFYLGIVLIIILIFIYFYDLMVAIN